MTRDAIDKTLPELPWQKRERYLNIGISAEDTEMFVVDGAYARLAEEVLATNIPEKELQIAVNLITTEIRGQNPAPETLSRVLGSALAELAGMRVIGLISSAGAKQVVTSLLAEGRSSADIAKEMGLLQVNDTSALMAIVEEVIAEHAGVAEEVRNGKDKAVGFLVGMAMRKSKGSGNPGMFEKMMREKLLATSE